MKENYMETSRQRQPIFFVNDLETLKVLTDPLRMQILTILDPAPQTVNQVGEKLGLSSSRLYYHFNLLEARGLIAVVETRLVNNLIEKLYWVTADDIEIEPGLLNFSSEEGQDTITEVISSNLEATREDILRSIQARKVHLGLGGVEHPRNMTMINTKRRLKDSTYEAFTERLKAFVKEFSELPEEPESGDDVGVFNLACYLYPSYYFNESDENSSKE